MKLSEVIHYYVGCAVMINKKTYTLLGAKGDLVLIDDQQYVRDIKDIKIFLRPLDDIKEVEYAYMNEHFPEIDNDPLLSGSEKEARKVHYLLSKRFDLFGLIDSEQALDITKQ